MEGSNMKSIDFTRTGLALEAITSSCARFTVMHHKKVAVIYISSGMAEMIGDDILEVFGKRALVDLTLPGISCYARRMPR
jgi:hypothetical protein